MSDLFLSALRQVLSGRSLPPFFEDISPESEEAKILSELINLRHVLYTFSKGDLDVTVEGRNMLAGSLKTLQAYLRHLTWQVQQVAKGDFSQRVEFMGEFSEAFNSMALQLEEAKKTLVHQAMHDSLTGLPNRYLLDDRMRQHELQAQRTGNAFILATLDVDYFKQVNDKFGHAAGDAVLVELARRLRACMRDTDTVARTGGDEFIFLYDCVSGSETYVTQLVISRLYQLLAKPATIEGKEFQIAISIGISFYPEHAQNAQELFRLSDEALYQAKKQGRNQFAVWQNDLS